MNRFWLCASVLALMTGLASPSFAEELPLKRVTLSTSGLAQFERHGPITGDAQISLPVRLDQVDDILKSLVVLDQDGSFAGVTLPGREPLSQIFRDLPFGRQALNSPDGLLKSLQGTEVAITGPENVFGKLLSITPETETSKDGGQITRHRIAVMGASGLHTLLLEDLDALQWSDPVIRKQLDEALSALHAHRIQDQRVLTLDLRGKGERNVTISYVTAAPLWKSAYRLVLPDGNSTSKAFLQGWAILENTTGQDWDDVAVTLLSGSPVTYRQSLYESYYRDRPYLPLRVMDQIMPRTDRGAIEFSADVAAPESPPTLMRAYGGADQNRPKSRTNSVVAQDSFASMAVAGSVAAPMPMAAVTTELAAAEMALAHIAFHFPQKISLPAGNSMMLPVIARDIPAEQLWLYQAETNARHPLAAVSLENNAHTALPTGILTLFEQTPSGLVYSGDAELSILPKGEKRYVTFALDPATLIDRTTRSEQLYGAITASKGIVRQSVVAKEITQYAIKAPAEEGRILVLEHPRREGWALSVDDAAPEQLEQSETHYRLKLSIKPGETRAITVALERKFFESLSISQLSPEQLTTRLSSLGEGISPKAKKALETAIALQKDVYGLDQEIRLLEQERKTIFNNQNRIRSNLTSIPEQSDLAKNYLADLGTQETRLKTIEASQTNLRNKHSEAAKKLADYIAGLDL